MIAPNVPGSAALREWWGRYARRIVNVSPPVLSIIGKQHNNRRVFSGFSLVGFSSAHQNGKHSTRLAIEKKEQL